jgi:hypothetical protein
LFFAEKDCFLMVLCTAAQGVSPICHKSFAESVAGAKSLISKDLKSSTFLLGQESAL